MTRRARDFVKMHGLGNDFVLMDARDGAPEMDAAEAREMADRRTGIGCDQVLVIEAPRDAGQHAWYRIYNHDGGEVEQCGNGARCIARYLRDGGLDDDPLVLGSRGGSVRCWVLADGRVTVDMGVPDFTPAAIPFMAPADSVADTGAASYALDVDGEQRQVGVVSMGNPHCVLTVDDVRQAPVGLLGERIESHRAFPMRTNVGFMQVLGPDHIRLRVFERGTGETLACGTGACAAVAVGRRQSLLEEAVTVDLPGGRLELSWAGEGEPVYMTGPATEVFRGRTTEQDGT